MVKSYKISKKEVERSNSSSEISQKIIKLKQDFKLKDEEILNLINQQTLIQEIIKLKNQNKISEDGLSEIFNEEILIPVSIFSNSSPLESLVKYLKENAGLRFIEVAKLTKRDQRTIWATYNHIIKKKINLRINSKILIPVSIFSNRKLSVLENLILYLNKNFTLKQISLIINRDYKTIWTCYNRSKKKCQI